jgi:hypothetical protein
MHIRVVSHAYQKMKCIFNHVCAPPYSSPMPNSIRSIWGTTDNSQSVNSQIWVTQCKLYNAVRSHSQKGWICKRIISEMSDAIILIGIIWQSDLRMLDGTLVGSKKRKLSHAYLLFKCSPIVDGLFGKAKCLVKFLTWNGHHPQPKVAWRYYCSQ